ncbi:unnamed protein product [Prorocentrum cordatum]|uniref:ABC transporter domain-containing protein n=1 Tax=Prorocentrum cordatum TaxID=2364126 RepID=A0ABN9R6I2_9DINO|nr:unnamed protein product [Polarella glacialis]
MGLIGRSGSGKTTLLDVLANRGLRGGARASGTLLIKGNVAASVDPARISEAVRYCQQVELLPENLTVMEFLAFHVAIRSLNFDPAAARLQARAHAPNFGLGNLVDKPISMLSGGQKKRVAVAMEMIKPSLLCIFDEPFSGLDSNTTFQLFRNVKASLRRNGSASIMTLHTVTPQVFDELDLVMMLHGGRQVFFGSPEQAAGYCASELGRPIPPGWTASDHFLKAVYDLEEAKPGHAAECSATWKDRLDRTAAASADAEALPCQKVSARRQFQLLLRRELMQELPVVLSLHQLAQYAAISLIVGWLYFGVASGTKQRDLRESVSLCFYTTTLWTFTPLYGAIMRTRLRLHRVDAELKKGILTVGPFAAATSVVDVVLHSIWPTLYGVVVFAMTDSGQDPVSFFNMVVLVVLCAVTYQSLGVLISVLLPDVDAAMALATAFAQTTLVAGGFYRTMPHSIAWYGSVSVTTYAFRGLLRASLSWMNTYECHPNVMGDTRAGQSSCFIEMSGIIDDLRLRGIEVATSPVDATPLLEQTVLVLFLVFSRILAYFVLRWRLRRSYTNWS